MAATSKIAIPIVSSFFEASAKRVFWPLELRDVFARHWAEWNVPRTMKFSALLEFLLHHTQLEELKLKCSGYPSLVRYTWGDVSPLLVALSVNRKTYLSHGSALWMHGLGGDPRLLYVNHEQREKPPNNGSLTQEGVDRAFKNHPRHTKLIYLLSGAKIAVLNGKFTGQLGVEKRPSPTGDTVDVTSLERTLIDVAVRPHYAGGVSVVRNAFAAARGGISTQRLARMLKRLDYTYPYHQAIGFYLEHSGYGVKDQELFEAMGINLNFHLSYGLRSPLFDAKWQVWYPATLR